MLTSFFWIVIPRGITTYQRSQAVAGVHGNDREPMDYTDHLIDCVGQHQAEAVKLWRTAMTGCFRTTRTNDSKVWHSVAACRSEQTRYCTAWPSFRKSNLFFLHVLGCCYVMTASECIGCWCTFMNCCSLLLIYVNFSLLFIIAVLQLWHCLHPTWYWRIGKLCASISS